MPIVNGESLSADEAMRRELCPECGTPINAQTAHAHAVNHYGGRPEAPHLGDEARRRCRFLVTFGQQRAVATDPGQPSHDTRPFWIDQLIATLIAGAGVTFFPQYLWPGAALFLGGVAWLFYLRREPKPMSTQVRTPNMIAVAVLFLATVVMGYDIYDRHYGYTVAPSDPRDPASKEQKVISNLAIKGLFKVHVYCLMTESDSCRYAKDWLRVLEVAGWKTGSAINETDSNKPISGLFVCPNDSHASQMAAGEFELALRESAIRVSDQCPDQELAKDPNFDFAFLVGSR